MSIKGHIIAQGEKGFKISWYIISLKYYSSEEVKNYNTKSDKLIYKVEVYFNIKSNNSYILAEPNETTKISETNNKLAAIEESINYIMTTPKAPSTVVKNGKKKAKILKVLKWAGLVYLLQIQYYLISHLLFVKKSALLQKYLYWV